MRSEELDLDRYDSDKIPAGLIPWYDLYLDSMVDREVRLLELGVFRGESLRLWRDYFPRGTIVGIDSEPPPDLDGEPRIHLFAGLQQDTDFLSRVARRMAPAGFDVIIDDASHVASLSRITFWHLFTNHLRPGGLYAIEDWGTGYWDIWPDGRALTADDAATRRAFEEGGPLYGLRSVAECPSHAYGMVGFIKELIDEQGAADVIKAGPDGKPLRESMFSFMIVIPGAVFIKKRPVTRPSAPASHG